MTTDPKLLEALAAGQIVWDVPEENVRFIAVNYQDKAQLVLAHLPRREVIILSAQEKVDFQQVIAEYKGDMGKTNKAVFEFANKVCR